MWCGAEKTKLKSRTLIGPTELEGEVDDHIQAVLGLLILVNFLRLPFGVSSSVGHMLPPRGRLPNQDGEESIFSSGLSAV